MLIVRQRIHDGAVGAVDILGLAAQRDPAEWALPLGEERPDVGGHEARNVEGIADTRLERETAQVVAVIEGLGAQALETEHGRDVLADRVLDHLEVFLRIAVAQVGGLVDGERRRDIAAQRIVGRRLVGDDVGLQAAAQEFRVDLRGIADHADRRRRLRLAGLFRPFDRLVEAGGRLVEVAGLEPALDPGRVDLDAERDTFVHRHGQRLRAAHAAEPAGEDDPAAQRAVESLGGQRAEGLVGSLENPLAADVDPAAGGHLAVHDQAEPLELPEVFPRGPARHQEAVGDQYARGVLVGGEDAHWFPGLHQQRLVVLQPSQRRDDGVEGRPVAGGLARAAVDDQVFRALGDLRVEVVAEHAQRGLLLPAAGAQLGAACGADRGGDAQWAPPCPPPRAGEGIASPFPASRGGTIVARRPLRTSSMAAWISGSSTRSWSSVGIFSLIAACASPVRRPGFNGASRSMPCAAPSASSARMASTLVATWRARCALCQPMLLWSSWSAEVGSECTLAGVASSWLSVARAAAVY